MVHHNSKISVIRINQWTVAMYMELLFSYGKWTLKIFVAVD